jgi:hypothetical protein
MTDKLIRTQMKPPAPRISHAPWFGYTRHECRREEPLAVCPSPRCRRAKACIGAHLGLYCRRTHHSPAEKAHRDLAHPLRRQFETVPDMATHRFDFSGKMERISEMAQLRWDFDKEMTARWKAGEFDALYGKYSPKGVVLEPPVRAYVEPSLTPPPPSC